jgi:NADH dehydrogenase FAD-containing subunit
MRYFKNLFSTLSPLAAAAASLSSLSNALYCEPTEKADYVIIAGKRQNVYAYEAEREVLKQAKRGTRVLLLAEDEISEKDDENDDNKKSINLARTRGIIRKAQRFSRKDTGEAEIELVSDERLVRNALGPNLDVKYKKVLLFPGPGPISVSAAAIDLTSSDVIKNVRVALPDSFATVAREILQKKKNHITICGGSWAGLSLASELRLLTGGNVPLSFVTQEPHVLSEVLPRYLCEVIHKRLKLAGVDLRAFSLIQFMGRGDMIVRDKNDASTGAIEVYSVSSFDSLQTSSFPTDSVIFAPHAESIPADFTFCAGAGSPSLKARVASINGLEADAVRGGIAVNSELSASRDVFVAGAGASFPDPLHGRQRLPNSSDHNMSSAVLAATNMVISGENLDAPLKRYKCPVPVERFILPGLGLAAVCIGKVTSRAETYGYFLRRLPLSATTSLQPHQLGVVFSVAEGKVIGALLWGIDSWRGGQPMISAADGSVSPRKSPVEMVADNSSSALVLCSRLIAGCAAEPFFASIEGKTRTNGESIGGGRSEIAPLLEVVAKSVMLALTSSSSTTTEIKIEDAQDASNNFLMQWSAPRPAFAKVNADILGVAHTYLDK